MAIAIPMTRRALLVNCDFFNLIEICIKFAKSLRIFVHFLNVGGFKKFSTYKAYKALSQELSGHNATKIFPSL
jgi:hypothetical protein